jgi:protein-tyrosine phosphatase
MQIKGIIRLNENLYDEYAFKAEGIDVFDLEFLDGSCPNEVIIS